ncbi:DNA methyltransferase [Streptomyces sediminimaris]|uniref:DNA methyltransferase n=1 Tax=Streptomyces sediminimaris TaxID=3383721 RepID=UPI00399BE181
MILLGDTITHPQPGHLRQQCEFIVGSSNDAMTPGNQSVYLLGHLTGNPPRGNARQHITQKPVEVKQQLLRIVPAGGTMMDPFTGSGTTGAAALHEDRSFVEIAQSATYAQTVRGRLTVIALHTA